ncbi:MAG: hypothetical protein WB439_00560 [Acidobacteriaceae bacterium]
MTARRAIYGQIANTVVVKGKGTEVVGIESERLLSRLLFFDEVVIDSVNLGEIPLLVKMFGREGLEELLRSDTLKLTNERCVIITDRHFSGVRKLPMLEFEQGFAKLEDNPHNLEMNFQCLRRITGLSNAHREQLSSFITQKLVRLSSLYSENLLAQVRKDLTTNMTLLKTVLVHKRPELNLGEITMKVHDLGGGRQRFETNLQDKLKITAEQEHALLAEVVTGTANINQRIATMAEYQAISEFEDTEAPLLFGKVHSVVQSINPKQDEHAFLRVIELTDIPKLISNRRIDVEMLMNIRNTGECREFRNWLSTTDHIEEDELKRLLMGFRAKAASFISSGPGKGVRFAVNTALGLIPGYGSAVAAGEGLVDTFLIDKILPSSGVISFLTNTVPSVFRSA